MFWMGIMTMAWGHPLGPEGWSAYTAIRVGQETPEVVVVLEVPAEEAVTRFQAFAGEVVDEEAETRFRAHMWSQLAEGLTVRLNEEPVPGAWEPVWTPVNGRLAEGFFVYLLRFERDGGWGLPERWSLSVDNQAFPDEPTWRSAWVEAEPPWDLEGHSASTLLPRLVAEPSTVAEVWTQDVRLKEFRIEVRRGVKSRNKAIQPRGERGEDGGV